MSAKVDEQVLLALLHELAIDNQRIGRSAITSVEEYYVQGIKSPDQGIKNLLLHNRKGTHHYPVLLDERKEVDLPGVAERIGESRLSLTSVEHLCEYLGVELGYVTPLVLVSDSQYRIEVLLGDAVHRDRLFGFHLPVSIITECTRCADLLASLVHTGREPRLTRMQAAVLHLLAPVSFEGVVPTVAQRVDLGGFAPGPDSQLQAGTLPVRLVQAVNPRQVRVAADFRPSRRASVTEHPTLGLDKANQTVQRVIMGEGATVVG